MAKTADALYDAAEKNPAVKADLQALFDSISHGGAVSPGLVAFVGAELAQHNVNLDSQLIAFGLGLLVTGASYLWQWVTVRFNKPKTSGASK